MSEMDPIPEAPARRGAPSWVRVALMVGPAVALVVVLALAVTNRGTPRPGDDAPGFSGPLLGANGTFGDEDLKGKPAVLNFWASWCEPCKDEAPMLNDAYRRYGDRVAFVGINIKDARSDALDFMDEYGIEYPNVRDEGSRIYADFGLTGQPETFFVDSDGRIAEHIPGPLFADDLDRLLSELVRDG